MSVIKKHLKKPVNRLLRIWPFHGLTRGIPVGVVEHTAAWVSRLKKSNGGEGLPRLFELSKGDVTEQPSPVRLNEETPDRYKWNRPWTNDGTFVLEAAGLRYDTLTNSVITNEYLLLYDLSRQVLNVSRDHALLSDWRLPKPKWIKGYSLILSARGAHDNYFHWMTMVLPRLKLLADAGMELDAFNSVLVNGIKYPFQKDTLDLFGINLDRIIYPEGREQYHFERVVVPSLPYRDSFVRLWAIEYLRDKILGFRKKRIEEAGDLIYISRDDAQCRRVRNEDRLVEMLSARGFKTHRLGGKTVAEQSEIFSNARCVIAPHGAGLTNLIFCPFGVDVIELHALDYYSSAFWWISTRMGHRHAVFDSLPDANGNPFPLQMIEVNIDRMQRHLDTVLESPQRGDEITLIP